MIVFNKPTQTGKESEYVLEAIKQNRLSGDGGFQAKCQNWFESRIGCRRAFLTPSCTAALEMAAILIDIQPGDEVIMPSYTFVSTANAFVLRGAKIVFVDIRPDTMNIDADQIEGAITAKTKAIVAVHYAGVSCDMDRIMQISAQYSLFVIEDAAQGVGAFYGRTSLGAIGHLAAFSFHETKNLSSGGEGGLLLVNEDRFVKRAEIIREKGTNRSQFFRGQVDKYTWVDIGSSFLLSELQAAYLWAQLELLHEITAERVAKWDTYYKALSGHDKISVPNVPEHCKHNGHIFFIKLRDLNQRTLFMKQMHDRGVMCLFHYVPLHTSPFGLRKSKFYGTDANTTRESERIVRLPIWHALDEQRIERVISSTLSVLEGF